MDRFNELRVFVAVADHGEMAKAAAVLHASPPSVTRTLAALEERLGIRLFDRTTRSLRLTEPGARFLGDARRVLGDLEAAEQDAAGHAIAAAGTLVVTTSLTFGRAVLQPIVFDFLDRYPRVNVSLLLFDRVVDLVDEGFDLAVRLGTLPDSSLTASKVGEVRRILVASPAYLANRPPPAVPEDLRLHAIISQTALMPNREWRYWRDGKPARIVLPARLEVNDAHACIAAAEEGKGITIALSYMVKEALRDGRLVPVLPLFAPPPIPVHVVSAQRRIVAPKVRAFIDFASPRLKSALAGAVPALHATRG
jgi:DNA-binding transcriptional LysR family regulator